MYKQAILITAATILIAVNIVAQSTDLTYQGQLQNASAAANGTFDFEFLLFDSGGSQIGPVLSRNGVAVTNGIFSVNLDFGSSFPGASRFLEIRVRPAGGGAFTTLSPRQPLTSTPYAVKSLTAGSADNAINATNAVTATNFTGNLTGDVTGTQNATTVARIQNRNVAATAPSNGQVLKYNAATSQWAPDIDNTGSGGGGTITGITAGTGLTGGGTAGSVTLGITPAGVGSNEIANNAVTDPKIATGAVTAAKIPTGQVVKNLNGLTDNVTLAAGSNVTITPAGNTLTIAATGGTSGITGGGTAGRIPLFSGATAIGDSLIAQSGNLVQIPVHGITIEADGDIRIGQDAGYLSKFQVTADADKAGLIGVSQTGAGVGGVSNASSGRGVNGFSSSGLGIFGGSNTGTGVLGSASTQGAIALRASGSSWFHGDTTPLSVSQTGTGEGIVVGSVGGYGYIAAWDFGVFQSRNLVLNRDGGNVGINTAAPTLPLDVNGRARIRSIPNLGGTTGTVCFNPLGDLLQCGASSLKWKTNIRPFRSGLDSILRLHPISYNWKDDGRADFGLGAEDVARVAPELSYTNERGEAEGVKYEKLNLLLINAVKEQQAQIRSQGRLIEQQIRANVRQQIQIEALRKLVCRQNRRIAACKVIR